MADNFPDNCRQKPSCYWLIAEIIPPLMIPLNCSERLIPAIVIIEASLFPPSVIFQRAPIYGSVTYFDYFLLFIGWRPFTFEKEKTAAKQGSYSYRLALLLIILSFCWTVPLMKIFRSRENFLQHITQMVTIFAKNSSGKRFFKESRCNKDQDLLRYEIVRSY
jgi:hypothetical protein